MRSLRMMSLALIVPALTALLVIGCGKKKDDDGDDLDKTPAKVEKSGGGDKSMTAVDAKGTTTLKGKVTFDGTPPAPGDLKDAMAKQTDKDFCLKGPTADPTLLVKDGGVANVVVFVRPPDGKFFKAPAPDSFPKEVKIDQPFCMFEPHVSVAFPSYTTYEGGKKKVNKTGQKVMVLNDASITHNTKWEGGNEIIPAKPAGGEPKSVELTGTSPNYTKPLVIGCNIHNWMSGYVWLLETPYAAVTKEDGTYEIKGVPAGTPVNVVVWQEKNGWANGGAKGQSMTLKEGEDVQDFKIK